MNVYTILFKNGDCLEAAGASLEDALAALGRKASDVRRAMVDRRPYESAIDARARELGSAP